MLANGNTLSRWHTSVDVFWGALHKGKGLGRPTLELCMAHGGTGSVLLLLSAQKLTCSFFKTLPELPGGE